MEQRRRQAAESLLTHSLFGFQVHDAIVSERLRELQELLVATCTERDQIALLSENIREIEDQLKTHSERFLLEPLRRFEQEMELLLDVGSEEDDANMTEEEEEDPLLLTDDEERLSLYQKPLPCTFLDGNAGAKLKKKEEEEMLCGVCCAPDSLEKDPIIICEVCSVAVHQTCYRLAVVPEGDWYCHPCRQYLDAQDIEKNLIPTHELECEACCTKAGAMTPTVDGGWVHVACSMFLPELYLQDNRTSKSEGLPDDLQIVCGLDKLKQRRRLRCCFCKKTNEKGACAQCAVGKCVVAYHALCALRNGIKLRYMDDKGQFGSGCLKHQAEFMKVGKCAEIDVTGSGKDGVNLVEKTSGFKRKRPRQDSWSDDDVSASDDTNDDDNELDSDNDSDGSQDSLSDDDQCLGDEEQKVSTQLTPSPRLPGEPPSKKSDGKHYCRSKRSRQTKLSFASAEGTPARTTSAFASPVTTDTVLALATHQSAQTHEDVSSNCRVVLETNVFSPSFYPSTYVREEPDERDFEYVMILISSRPLGLGIASLRNRHGIFLLAQSTRNPAVLAALERGVIQNGDEVFACNDLILRKTSLEIFESDVVPTLSLPIRCWFRTKRKSNILTPARCHAVPAGVETPVSVFSTPVSATQEAVAPLTMAATSPPDSRRFDLARSRDTVYEGDREAVSVGIDWPWVFLRSDGKLAMNLFWKTLDSAFFQRKISKRTFAQLQGKVEDTCGVRLNRSHSEYDQVRELLVMPRRERVPAYLIDFRNNRKQKQKFLSSDVLSGTCGDTETDVDEETALEVGTTVSVAKRTWPGMNKLGGVGRIKKVNEEVLPNGRKRFTYNIAYVLSGNEKNVERKYISVVDIDAEEPDKKEENCSTSTSRRQKCETEAESEGMEKVDASVSSLRLLVDMSRTANIEKLSALPEIAVEKPLKRHRFQLQFSAADSAVYCERKTERIGHALPAKELLLHRHFDIKLPEAEVLTNACFFAELVSVEDRNGDEVSDDDTDSEAEGDEIRDELAALQQQFRSVMESNELAFACLTRKVEEEHVSKEYRRYELEKIQWRNYERMYQELQAAQRQFDESDEDSDDGQIAGSGAKADSDEGEGSENEDITFGGMFVNKLKQEGSEVCALCELSGGDFTATDTGRVVHPQCAMFTPETFFKDGVVHGIDLVDPQRQRLKCSLCGGRKGLSKIQCAHRKCVRAYHVACAFVNGLLTRDPYYQAWCPRHLKTSGMGQFVELPDHLNKETHTETTTTNATPLHNRKSSKSRLSHQKKNRGRHDATPTKTTAVARTDVPSSSINQKRKRAGSNKSATANTNVGGYQDVHRDQSSSFCNAFASEKEGPRCARRLEIDEPSDDSDHEGKAVEAWQHGRDLQRVFLKNEVVEVLARDWRGINKPGGVARVRAVELVPNGEGGKDAFYDVVHIVGAFKEKRVPAKFVRSYDPSDAE